MIIIIIYKIIFIVCACVCRAAAEELQSTVRINIRVPEGRDFAALRGGANPVAAPARPATTTGRARETRRRRSGVVV